MFGPAVKVVRGIARLDVFLGPHQPQIMEVRARRLDRRKRVVICKDHGDAMPARHVIKLLALENFVAHLHRMAERQAIDLTGQQLQKAFKILWVEFFCGHELPIDRPEPVAQRAHSLADELAD